MKKIFCILMFLFSIVSPLVLNSVDASDTPAPTDVTVAGNVQSELGCPGDWQPECTATNLSFDANDNVWQNTFLVPAGSWEYKAALNDSWTENYGAGGVRDGANIGLNLAVPTNVKFYYDHETHWITDNANAIIATVPGSYQSEIGCSGDWDPSCLRSWLQDPDGDGIYSFSTTAIPAGNYEVKVAIDESWGENYGLDGIANGPNIPFSVPTDGVAVTFGYDSATHILTIQIGSVFVTDLIAGGGSRGKSAIDVGDVFVWTDAENLYVKYIVDEPWCITETHLHIATSLGDIPQKKGNPLPGNFTYGNIHNCVMEVTFEIPRQWAPGTQLYIAAHAVVKKEVIIQGIPTFKYETAWGDGTKFPGKNWATYFTYTLPNPAIDIEKFINGEDADAAPGPTVGFGDSVTFQYVVTNTGDVPLSNVSVTDDVLGPICTVGGPVNPGGSFTCSVTITASGSGQQSNTGTVTATAPDASSVTDSDLAHFVVVSTASIGDFVWNDANRNGIQDSGEQGAAEATVELYTCAGNQLVASTTTDATGMYMFSNISPGDYYLKFIAPVGYSFTLLNQGGDETLDSDASSDGYTSCTTLQSGENDLSWDAGLLQ